MQGKLFETDKYEYYGDTNVVSTQTHNDMAYGQYTEVYKFNEKGDQTSMECSDENGLYYAQNREIEYWDNDNIKSAQVFERDDNGKKYIESVSYHDEQGRCRLTQNGDDMSTFRSKYDDEANTIEQEWLDEDWFVKTQKFDFEDDQYMKVENHSNKDSNNFRCKINNNNHTYNEYSKWDYSFRENQYDRFGNKVAEIEYVPYKVKLNKYDDNNNRLYSDEYLLQHPNQFSLSRNRFELQSSSKYINDYDDKNRLVNQEHYLITAEDMVDKNKWYTGLDLLDEFLNNNK